MPVCGPSRLALGYANGCKRQIAIYRSTVTSAGWWQVVGTRLIVIIIDIQSWKKSDKAPLEKCFAGKGLSIYLHYQSCR